MKALVVDDVAYSCIIVKKALEQAGIDVFSAASGADALTLLQQEDDIDVVITDLMMPGMDGIQFYERLKEEQEANAEQTSAPLPPFILLTASPEPKLLRKAKQAGFADVMVKPLDSKRLLQTLKKCLGDEPKEECEYSRTLQALESAVDEAVKTANRKTASFLRQQLQCGIDRLDVLLAKTDTEN